MALDRDELAARCLVARLTDVEYATLPIDAADAAVAMADALLARLAQDRPAAPLRAATPAAYVPQVGDVVRHRETADEERFLWLVVSPSRMVKLTEPRLVNDGMTRSWWAAQVFVRRATSSERAAAGLPVDESAGDRVALAKVILDCGVLLNETGSFHVADAVLAFMAKAPAFDEDAERKAAWTRWKMAENDGFKSGDWNPYIAGWLARARVAAKGGAS